MNGPYVQTPESSRFGGLILPRETLASIVRQEVGSSYASVNPRNKNTIGWATSSGSADADSVPYANPLRFQARDLDRNNPLASGALETIIDNVVATGLRPQANIDRTILGLSEDEASAWQTEAERFYYIWANSKDCDATRQSTFWELQALVLLNTLMSGDVFNIRRFKERPGSVFGTCVQMVEADRCETPPAKDGVDSRVVGGVQTDADGEAVRYWFLKNHPGDLFLHGRMLEANEYVSVPAYDDEGFALCLHHYVKRRPDQKRGISILAPVLEQFKMLGRYTEAELSAAVVSAMFSVFVKSDMPASVGGLPGAIPGMVGGNQVAPKGNGLTKLQSGMIVDLAPGEDVTFANPNRPNTAFDPFTDAIYKHIGVGLGLPKEVMLKNFVSSYSASRAAIMEAWKMFRRRRHWLVASFCQPSYAWVISEAVGRGYLRAPGFFDDPLRRAAWLGTTWRGAPMGQLDPLKEAKAARQWLGIPGALTIQQLTAEQFGTDYEDNLGQIARERTQIAALPEDPLAPAVAATAEPGEEGGERAAASDDSGELLQAITGLIAGPPDEDDDDD
jgi:lambda family phage portal protein